MADKDPKPTTSAPPGRPAESPAIRAVVEPPRPSTKAGAGSTKPEAPKGGDIPTKETTGKNDVPSFISEENKKKNNNLTQAKDRAQLTATSAMSVVHVALLKELIVTGPEQAHFYTMSMVLISTCLILQIIAGIISLTTSHMRAYYAEYKGDICEDIFSNLCCCKLRFRKKRAEKEKLKAKEEAKKKTTYGSIEKQPRPPLITMPSTTSMKIEDCDSHEEEPGCCPCYITTEIYPDMESEVLDRYDHWCERQLDIDLEAAEAKVHMTRIKEIIVDAKKKLEDFKKSKEERTEEIEEEEKDIKDMLEEAERWKKIYQDYLWSQEVAMVSGRVLWEQASDIREYHMLSATTFWQQVLNYIFYIVFVLNAFITGLGIAELHHESNPTAPASAAGNVTSQTA